MRYRYYTPEERRLRIVVIILAVVVFVLAILAIKGCSDRPEPPHGGETDPSIVFPVTPRDTIYIQTDTIITPNDTIIISNYIKETPVETIVVLRDTVVIPKNGYNGIGINPNSPPSDHPGDIDPGSTGDGSSTDPGRPSNPVQPGGIGPAPNPGGTGSATPPPDPGEKHPGEEPPPIPPQNPSDVGNDDDPHGGDLFKPGGLLPNGGKKGGILWIIILIILLIFYISGRVIIFRGGALRIWASTFDKILVAAAAVLFLISCLFDPNPNQPPAEIVVTLRSISGALMTWSCILSVLINWPNPLFIIISILCKAFFFYCVWWFFFLAILIALISLAFRVANDLTDYRHNDY